MHHPRDAYWPEVIQSYKQTRRQLQRSLREEKQNKVVDAGKTESINASIRDVEHAIDWMAQGWQPGCQRDMDRRSREQREVLVDPIRMQSLYEGYMPLEEEERVPVDQIEYIESVLETLSRRERECFIMHHVGCLSHKKISDILKISRGNVYTNLMRAREKIRKYRKEHRFDFYSETDLLADSL